MPSRMTRCKMDCGPINLPYKERDQDRMSVAIDTALCGFHSHCVSVSFTMKESDIDFLHDRNGRSLSKTY